MLRPNLTLALSLALAGSAAAQWSVEVEKLTASDAGSGDRFGQALALEGDTLVIGAPSADVGGLADAGAAYVFSRSGATGAWVEVAKLVSSAPEAGSAFGESVAIAGGRIAVGAPLHDGAGLADAGAVEVFVPSGQVWGASQWLVAPAPAPGDRFGRALALDADRMIVGAPGTTAFPYTPGAAYAYLLAGAGGFGLEATLPSTQPPLHSLGTSVDLDGDLAVVGVPTADGLALLFARTASGWVLEKVSVPRACCLTGYLGTAYGSSVSLSGEYAVVGAPGAIAGSGLGNVQVQRRSGSSWSFEVGFQKNFPLYQEEYGAAVSIDGNLTAIGAPGGKLGLVFVKQRSGSTWTQVEKLKPADGTSGDRFGDAVAVDGRRVAVGAPFHGPGFPKQDPGAVYVHDLQSPAPQVYCTAGTSASGCVPAVVASGTPSASAPSGFRLDASGVEGGRIGMLVLGTAGQQAVPFGATSFQCVTAPRVFAGALPGSGQLGTCGGSYSVDLNALLCPGCPLAAANPGPWATLQAQFWYRDPLNPGGSTTSLTQAVELVLGP